MFLKLILVLSIKGTEFKLGQHHWGQGYLLIDRRFQKRAPGSGQNSVWKSKKCERMRLGDHSWVNFKDDQAWTGWELLVSVCALRKCTVGIKGRTSWHAYYSEWPVSSWVPALCPKSYTDTFLRRGVMMARCHPWLRHHGSLEPRPSSAERREEDFKQGYISGVQGLSNFTFLKRYTKLFWHKGRDFLSKICNDL